MEVSVDKPSAVKCLAANFHPWNVWDVITHQVFTGAVRICGV